MENIRSTTVPPGGNICTMDTTVDTSNCSMKGFKQIPIRKKMEEMSWKAEGCDGGQASMVNNWSAKFRKAGWELSMTGWVSSVQTTESTKNI